MRPTYVPTWPAALAGSCPRQDRVFKDRCVVTTGGEKHECVPDRVLKAQAPPNVKDESRRIHHPSCREKPDSQTGKRGNNGLVGRHTTPTENQIESHGCAIET